MPTPWNTESRPSPATYSERVKITTEWPAGFGGAYLMTVSGKYVTDVLGRRIVVIIRGGSIPFSTASWNPRNPI